MRTWLGVVIAISACQRGPVEVPPAPESCGQYPWRTSRPVLTACGEVFCGVYAFKPDGSSSRLAAGEYGLGAAGSDWFVVGGSSGVFAVAATGSMRTLEPGRADAPLVVTSRWHAGRWLYILASNPVLLRSFDATTGTVSTLSTLPALPTEQGAGHGTVNPMIAVADDGAVVLALQDGVYRVPPGGSVEQLVATPHPASVATSGTTVFYSDAGGVFRSSPSGSERLSELTGVIEVLGDQLVIATGGGVRTVPLTGGPAVTWLTGRRYTSGLKVGEKRVNVGVPCGDVNVGTLELDLDSNQARWLSSVEGWPYRDDLLDTSEIDGFGGWLRRAFTATTVYVW